MSRSVGSLRLVGHTASSGDQDFGEPGRASRVATAGRAQVGRQVGQEDPGSGLKNGGPRLGGTAKVGKKCGRRLVFFIFFRRGAIWDD